ncbi:hypothetical protein N7492_008242 [Penicillium capsulatum]|uniref:Uncharacterized protein n=1 Tax=Penicillium capsulatum TaxID=69766 RepID=A0A9W9HS82_9EURO|nr:hypothetical protein N7492_008242 [Penicillium capsulatum]
MTEYLSVAKYYFDKDVLKHMAFNQRAWPTVHRILDSLVDSFEILSPYLIRPKIDLSPQLSASGESLDEMTSKVLRVDTKSAPASTSNPLSLNFWTKQPLAQVLTDRIGGEILYSLGMLVLEAADQPPAEARAAMSCVHRILARLHHLGLVSDRVYQFTVHDPTQLSIRPPALHLLSPTIMSILSDAAWLEHEAKLTSAAKEAGEDPPYLPFRVGCRELGPEIWMELILWCCIEHGLVKHGILLIQEMTKRSGDLAWKFESWTPLFKDIDTVQQTNVSTEQFWRRPDTSVPRPFKGNNKPPFNGLAKRTISLEIVACLRSVLANRAYNGIGFHGMSSSKLLARTRPLNTILEPTSSADDLQPTYRTSNWCVTRFVESGCLVPRNDPVSFERFLRSFRNQVPPWGEDLQTSSKELHNLTRAQLYDETAAFVGLVEHGIQGYTTGSRKSSVRAFFQYAWLQNIIDASKHNHIRAFFEHLSRSGPEEVPFFDSGLHDPSLAPNPSHSIASKSTMAGLLDLAVSSRSTQFGNWLLFNTDIDGPSIPPSDYGNPTLASSILRYAIMTRNEELAQKVFDSLQPPVSFNVLKTMANYQIVMHKWDSVAMTLDYLRNFRKSSWGHSNLITLGAEIIRLASSIERKVSNGIAVGEDEKEHLQSARDLLFRFYNEEFNLPNSKNPRGADFQRRVLHRLRDVFLSVPGELSRVANELVLKTPIKSPKKLQYIPPSSFQVLMSAVVDAHGSVAGKNLWSRWVFESPLQAGYIIEERGVERLRVRNERDLSAGDPEFNSKTFHNAQQKATMPSVNFLRPIARAALREFYAEPNDQNQSSPSLWDPWKIPLSKSKWTKYKLLPRHMYKYQTRHGGLPPVSDAEAVLDFCVSMMLRCGLREHQIHLEIPHHLERLRARGVLTRLDKEGRVRKYDTGDDPWMESSPRAQDGSCLIDSQEGLSSSTPAAHSSSGSSGM